jgi:hypothetical protein
MASPANVPLALHEVLEEEYERLHKKNPPSLDTRARSKVRLNSIYQDIHGKAHSALCLSGGGIRSATFALGVIQGMARKGLLERFSYLSTVSGGGYVGGWLSAWIHRHPKGLGGVTTALQEDPTHKNKIEPEPEPIQHLRSYSNYLTPRLGMFSADAWTVAAIAVRNLILNWLVLIPMMIGLLLVPRLAVASTMDIPHGSLRLYLILAVLAGGILLFLIGNKPFKLWTVLIVLVAYIALVISLWFSPLATTLFIGFAGGVVSVAYVGIKRPSSAVEYNDQKDFLKWCLLPLLASAVSLTTFWAWFRHTNLDAKTQLESWRFPSWTGFLSTQTPHYSIPFILFGFLLFLTGWTISAAWTGQFSSWKGKWKGRERKHRFYEFLAIATSGLVGGLFLWLIATKLFPDPASDPSSNTILYYISFASPIYLALFLLTAIVFAGIASEYTEDEDREWWSRFSAWILISITAWSVVSFLSLLGPRVFEFVQAKYIVPAGGLVGFLTTRLAQSAKTPAKDDEKGTGWRGVLRNYAIPLGALVFIALLIIVLTYGINYLLAILTIVFGSLSSNPRVKDIMGEEWLLTIRSMPYGSLASLDHMQIIREAPFRLLIVLLIVIAYAASWLSRRINTNKFSYHAMYRSRLIRAYLGASNESRFPNPFTGFDPNDNVPMFELRPEFFHSASFRDLNTLVRRLRNKEDAISIFFYDNLSPDTLQYLSDCDEHHAPSRLLQRALVQDLNNLVQKSDPIYDDTTAFSTINTARKFYEENTSHTDDRLPFINRRLIECAFPGLIHPCPEPPDVPLHVVNIALNLVHGKKLAWQDRKAASFTVSPLHSGSCQIPDFEDEDQKLPKYGSYRRSKEYGGTGGISLGTAVAISGAAVSPNMGYYSSTLVTFLMTLFNVRLGWWLGNPGKAGKDTYKVSNPKSSAHPIIAEALGLTDADNPYVYLSDGGHFENLGLYEMVLRRCHTIVVVDGSDDFEFQFDGLGNAIRKIRVDFGIPIEFDPMKILPRSKRHRGASCAIGHIRYSHVDAVPKRNGQRNAAAGPEPEGNETKDEATETMPAPDGVLIYIKPVFYGDEPRDIFHYAQANPRFPHESTADQWFSEEQFESYRSLGLFIVDQITANDGARKLDQFESYTSLSSSGSPQSDRKVESLHLDQFASLARRHVERTIIS